jgi:peroxiredoxin
LHRPAGLYEWLLPEFADPGNTALLGISVDGSWSHAAFVEAGNLSFSLLADFVINGDGIIQRSYQAPTSINPGTDDILTALEKLAGKWVMA